MSMLSTHLLDTMDKLFLFTFNLKVVRPTKNTIVLSFPRIKNSQLVKLEWHITTDSVTKLPFFSSPSGSFRPVWFTFVVL